jgi:succinate dehydrogenase flavoprotein subunit
VSINGANRLGSNSLPECLVFGARAGRAAAEYAAGAADPGAAAGVQAREEVRRLERDLRDRSDGRVRIADVRTAMQDVMEESAGIFRTEESLTKGAATLRDLQERASSLAIDDHSRAFNTQLVAALELSNMLDVADTIIASALQRQESRGAHQRLDFPARDDERFLAHSLVRRGPGGVPQVDYLPVTLTRWPPGERVYGR